MRQNNNDIQGRFFGLPYDFRVPTAAKVLQRVVQPRGPMFVPKVFGCGWTLNLAHRGTYLLLAASATFAIIVALLA